MDLDETLNDVRNILEAKGKKCLLIYGDHGPEEMVKVKFSSSLLDLNSMAASAVQCLAAELADEFGYDTQQSVEMALESVSDTVRRLSTIPPTGEQNAGR